MKNYAVLCRNKLLSKLKKMKERIKRIEYMIIGWYGITYPSLNYELHEIKMNLSRNFSLQELIKSDTAIRKGINNNPNSGQIEKLKALCENILQPVRDHFGRVKVTSGFRSEDLCLAIGSSRNSQHAKAEAADFECVGVDNAEVADWIKMNLETDQLILEFYTPGEPNSGWIHCSWIPEGRREQFMHAYKSEGKTKYKPIIGKAKDLV
jgi:zinc D-Ala-D-Ala carboxypeptidase